MTTATNTITRDEAAEFMAELKAFSLTLGRKFEDTDIDPDFLPFRFTLVVEDFVHNYRGDFEFIRSAQDQLNRKGSLSTGMLRGVLNCIRAQAMREQPQTVELGSDAFARIAELFETAAKHLKFPKIRLQTADGAPVVMSRAGRMSKTPGVINVTDGGPFGDNQFFGRVNVDGTYERRNAATDEIVSLLAAFAADPAGVAAEYGKLTGNCCFCNKTLTDTRSTEVGYGPICAGHYNLPWGE